MRVALLAVAMDHTSRSTNIARALSLTDAAAGSEPAPGLIVVPSGCDRARDDHHTHSRAMSEMYSASMSAKAREWGVLLAFGQRRFIDETPSDVAVLLDADGDERLVIRAGAAPESTADTVYGPMSLCMRAAGMPLAGLCAGWVGSQLTIVLGESVSGRDHAATDWEFCERIADSTGSCVCLVRAAVAPDVHDECVRCSEEMRLGAPWKLPQGDIVPAEVPMTTDVKLTP